MKKFVFSICLSILFCSSVYADAKFNIETVNSTTESLPRVEFKKDASANVFIKKNSDEKPAFNPKSTGLTNYQYDDTNYKYYKFEKYIKDNIEYSKSGSTKLY